jgi:hypothetical protein
VSFKEVDEQLVLGFPNVHASLAGRGPIVGDVATLLSTTFLPGKASLQPRLERRRDNRSRGPGRTEERPL